tara:strand:+ start:476 stop:673 length:198 start_codon:yes stop_codon:yes gene_type:complete
MIEKLLKVYGEYKKKYGDFPIVTFNLSEEDQESLADFVQIVLQENRQITEKEIQEFNDISEDIDI